ncbi:MAG TPA: DUF6183 family protein, partial [Acidimicrobiales bacterium]|nr:DUF6183 family protein [Acidimicrobiales bacterium]
LRDLSRAALERGRQLWPIASHAEHRLALEAPAAWAARMLVPATGHLGLGPIAEVAASTHAWAELAPYAPPTPVAAIAAHERVVRGEDVDAASVPVAVLDLPLRLQAWEPSYPVATYTAHGVEAPRPPLPPLAPAALSDPPARIDDDGARVLLDAVRHWSTDSNGRAEAVAVDGDAAAACAALGVSALRLGALAATGALALLAWAAASGGAHGRRRGTARGRFDAWWTAATLCGLDTNTLDPDELGDALDDLRWHWWDAAEPDTGWTLRLAVEDPLDGIAWAVSAADAV